MAGLVKRSAAEVFLLALAHGGGEFRAGSGGQVQNGSEVFLALQTIQALLSVFRVLEGEFDLADFILGNDDLAVFDVVRFKVFRGALTEAFQLTLNGVVEFHFQENGDAALKVETEVQDLGAVALPPLLNIVSQFLAEGGVRGGLVEFPLSDSLVGVLGHGVAVQGDALGVVIGSPAEGGMDKRDAGDKHDRDDDESG